MTDVDVLSADDGTFVGKDDGLEVGLWLGTLDSMIYENVIGADNGVFVGHQLVSVDSI